MRSCTIVRDGARLNGVDRGQGPAVVFQHGLGGDEAQVAEVFPDGAFRRLTLECRAQGGSDAGDPANFSLATFADDIMAFADARGLERFVVGGVSMGAALGLRIAITNPDRVSGLILARPAWAWGAAPANLQPIAALAPYVARGAREDFERSDAARDLARHAPDNLSSLLASFDRPDRAIRSRLLAAISADDPGVSEDDVRRIRVPTLVLGNTIDRLHPLALARQLAAAIPNARFVEIAPKSRDRPRYVAEFRAAVAEFLKQETGTS
jgi:pimeloyl-ACP methyl ester carboxylesterase